VALSKLVVETDENGIEREVRRSPIIYQCKTGNLIVDVGRINVLKQIPPSGLTSFSGINNFGYAGVGNTSTAAAAGDVKLGYEHIANANRISALNTSGSAFSNSDIIAETSGSNTQKLVMQFTWTSGDSNNTQVFSEYGIFSTATLPGTNTGTSGSMFARFVPSSSLTKGAFAVILSWTLQA